MHAYEDCMFITIERRRPQPSKSTSLDQPTETSNTSTDILSSSMPDFKEFTDTVVPAKPLPLPRRPKPQPRPVPRSRTMTQTPPKPAPRVPKTTKVVLRKVHDRPTSVSRYTLWYITWNKWSVVACVCFMYSFYISCPFWGFKHCSFYDLYGTIPILFLSNGEFSSVVSPTCIHKYNVLICIYVSL